MGIETKLKSKSGQIGIRYLRSEHERDRITEVFRFCDAGTFTLRDLKTEMPYLTSGDVEKWESAKIIRCVGRTPQTKTSGSVKIWKLDGNVISVLNARVV